MKIKDINSVHWNIRLWAIKEICEELDKYSKNTSVNDCIKILELFSKALKTEYENELKE